MFVPKRGVEPAVAEGLERRGVEVSDRAQRPANAPATSLPPQTEPENVERLPLQTNFLRMRERGRWAANAGRGSTASGNFVTSARVQNGSSAPLISSANLWGGSAGARIKLMRHVSFGWPRRAGPLDPGKPAAQVLKKGLPGDSTPLEETHGQDPQNVDWGSALQAVETKVQEHFQVPERPWVDVGIGLSYEADIQNLAAQARIKVKDFLSIKLSPTPTLKIQKRFALGNPEGLSLHLKYECPLSHLDDFYKPPHARFLLRLENNVGRVRLSPTGIDFDERVLPLGKGTSLRAAASVLFPRQIPVPEDQPLLDCRIHRLGLKSVW